MPERLNHSTRKGGLTPVVLTCYFMEELILTRFESVGLLNVKKTLKASYDIQTREEVLRYTSVHLSVSHTDSKQDESQLSKAMIQPFDRQPENRLTAKSIGC